MRKRGRRSFSLMLDAFAGRGFQHLYYRKKEIPRDASKISSVDR